MARRYAPLMETVVPKQGHVFVASDLVSAEPTIAAQYSKDPLMRYFAFEGTGKKPYYNENESVFFCDDVYISLAAVVPLWKPIIKQVIQNGVEGQNFQDFWVTNFEPGKKIKEFKSIRTLSKGLYLSMNYGMLPASIMKSANNMGANFTLKDAQTLYDSYWGMLPKVQQFANRCARKVKTDGFIVTPFGFHGKPLPKNAYNFMIQSSVNPIIDLLCTFTEENCDMEAIDYQFITIIHDEFVYECPIHQVNGFYHALQKAEKRLNATLNWEVPLRAGFTISENFYQIKEGMSLEKQHELGIYLTNVPQGG